MFYLKSGVAMSSFYGKSIFHVSLNYSSSTTIVDLQNHIKKIKVKKKIKVLTG